MRVILLASTAVLAFAPLSALAQSASAPDQASPAAQPTQNQTDSSAGDIIVTAQRRAERLQDVPVAISAYTSEKRDQLGIETIQDIAKFTPGVSFSEFPNRLFVRGVGRLTNQLGTDPSVATYVDGFYTSETTAIGSSPILVDRIEILRGPQGTLYGRNSIGGAANVISKRPTRELESEVRLMASDYKTFSGAAAISGPITDWLRFRVSGGAFNQGEGYLKSGNDADYNRSRFQLLEGQLEADVGGGGNAWIKYQYFKADGRPSLNTQIDPYETTKFFPDGNLVPSPTFGYTTPNPGASDLFRANLDYPGYEKIHNANQVIANLSWDFGGVVLKYIGGYQSSDYERSEDYDRTSRSSYVFNGQTISSFLVNTINDDKRFYSHEINLASDTDGPLKYIFGLYYYHEKERQTYASSAPFQPELGFVLDPPNYTGGTANPDRNFIALAARQTARSYAGYGQIDYKIVPTVTLTAGLRYSRDEKDDFESLRYNYFNPLVSPAYALNVTPAFNARNISGAWEALTGKAGVAWDPDRDTNVYASYSRGYKAGGFNLFSLTDPVDKESLNAFEVGLKKTLPGRIQANLAAFYYDYHNIQVPVTYVNVVVLPNFVNAPRARSYGAEAEVTWSPTDTLQVLLSYSYLNATLRKFCCYVDVTNPAAGQQDLAGNRLPQAPRNKITGSILNRFDIGGGVSLTPVATVNYTGAQYFAPFTTDKYKQDGYVRADFRLVLQTKDGLQVNGFLNNAFNERSFNGFQLGPQGAGFPRQVTINQPRTYGIELIGKF